MAKRKRCLNCGYADIIRILGKPARFPIGVYCDLLVPTPEDDPRDWIQSCDHVCDEWCPREERFLKPNTSGEGREV